MPRATPARGPSAVDVALDVNGQVRTAHIPPHRTLLDALREDLGLMGAKKVCDEGTCGACTVIVDGRPVYACLTLAIANEGRAIETVDGLGREGALHPVQEAFIAHDAFQCGFCTPGQVMSVVALLRDKPQPDADDVTRAVAGNLCRCGAYPNIVEAALAAAKTRRGGERAKRAHRDGAGAA